jgi:PAS domain S-box-containing protein
MLRRLFFPETPSPAAVRYGFAALACALAFAVRLSMEPFLLEHSPLLLFTLAVAVSAIRGGLGPGLFATVLGTLAGLFFFPPSMSLLIRSEYLTTAIFQLATFLTAGLIVSWLGGQLRDLRWQALETARQRTEILESITDGFEAFDAQCRFTYLNGVSEQMIGKTRGELLGRVIWEVRPEMRGTVMEQKFGEVVRQRVPVHFEFLSKTSNKWFEVHGHPARNGGLTAYVRDISERKVAELRLRETLAERDAALEHVQVLSGLLPICAACKKIRDDRGNWQPLESYISTHSEARFSHGMCPVCAEQYYGEAAAGLIR